MPKIKTFDDLDAKLDLLVRMVDDIRVACGYLSVNEEIANAQRDAQARVDEKKPKLN